MLESKRIIFKHWKDCDIALAYQLWGNSLVTRYIGSIDVETRYQLEVDNDQNYQVSYWPIFLKETDEFIGCCGLRPYQKNIYELGFHLLPDYWHHGYAYEVAMCVIDYAFSQMKVEKIITGHHPQNKDSQKLIERLNFKYVGKNYYKPTGLFHPSYELKDKK